MGFFKLSREEQERQYKQEKRTKAFSKFQSLIQELRPEWSLILGDSVTLSATCKFGQETLELRIEWGSGSITEVGDLRPGLQGYESVNFIVRSPSVEMFLIGERWNRIDDKDAWNQAEFDWLSDYGQNSKPLIELRERRLKLKQGLGL